MSVAQDIIIVVFSVTNACRIIAYAPQIVRLVLDRNGSAGVSSATWSLFFISNAATAAYAGTILGDVWMAVIFTLSAACSLAIVALALRARRAQGGQRPFRIGPSVRSVVANNDVSRAAFLAPQQD